MEIVSSATGYLLLVMFGTLMIFLTCAGSRHPKWREAEGFLTAGRNVSWRVGAFSIAVSWIWAPALFVSVQQAYQLGLPGIFWFTFPNILCLIIMAPLAARIRQRLPQGVTQPEWIRERFDERTHKTYLVPFFFYQLMAVAVQLHVGGRMVELLTGVPSPMVMIILLTTTGIYSLISGMRASIITDCLQYLMVLSCGILIIPWTVWKAGGIELVLSGMGGVDGSHKNIFDPGVAVSFGIITTIGLISGILADQQHWQRAFTVRENHLRRAYVVGGILFGIVPISLACLGFVAANPASGVSLPVGVDPALIGVAVVAKYLPTWAVVGFLLMLLSALCSVLDAGMVAAGSLYAVNCFPKLKAEKELLRKRASGVPLALQDLLALQMIDQTTIRRSRTGMVLISVAGLSVALAVNYIPGFGLKYLWWIFNTVAACIAVPTVLSLYWDRLTSQGVFWGITVGFVCGVPTFIYGSYTETVWISVAASLDIVLTTIFFAYFFREKRSVEPAAEAAMQPADETLRLQSFRKVGR